jgi:hypothetical protein
VPMHSTFAVPTGIWGFIVTNDTTARVLRSLG